MDTDETPPRKISRRPSSQNVPAGVRIFPNVWPGEPLVVQPGDVTKFVPMGCCFDGPVVMRPWDTLESAMTAGGYYGARSHSFHPLFGAPVTESSGGMLYFDSGADPDAVIGALRLMHAPLLSDQYAVFVSEAEDPRSEGFLVHCRIIPFGALGHFFSADPGAVEGALASQPMTMGDFVRGFIRLHEERYGTMMSSGLDGVMGGDGDWAREALCFGFMMENEYHSVCRIWTRAWLVTK